MNFSGISRGSFGGKLLRLPLRLIPPNMALVIVQGPLKGKRWLAGSSNHGCWLGSYEYHTSRLFAEMVREGSVVFDIGAHVGYYTLLASMAAGPAGRVVAFEPLPRNLRYLRHHVRLNRLTNVEIMSAAVSDVEGRCAFQEGPNSSEGAISPAGRLLIDMISLDGFLSGGRVPDPDVLKIDVEEAEARVLAGAAGLLARRHPAILLATHGRDVHAECCSYLRSFGYDLRSLDAESLENASEITATHPYDTLGMP